MFELTDKVALVTGGASGIGESICRSFARQGAQVVILDVKEDAGKALDAELQDAGQHAAFQFCDVTQQATLKQSFAKLYDTYGRLDILVNNAGIAHIGTAESTSEADFDRIYAVNVKGVYNCIHAALPLMRKQGGGNIINMASVAAMVGIQERFAYSTSKRAVLTMTYEVAKDYVKENIRCNSISPARVHTPFVDGYLAKTYPGREQEMYEVLAQTQPIGRMGTPDEVAALAVYLASDEAAFITGTNFPIDGGFVTLNT